MNIIFYAKNYLKLNTWEQIFCVMFVLKWYKRNYENFFIVSLPLCPAAKMCKKEKENLWSGYPQWHREIHGSLFMWTFLQYM